MPAKAQTLEFQFPKLQAGVCSFFPPVPPSLPHAPVFHVDAVHKFNLHQTPQVFAPSCWS